jgi:nitrite reductase (NO-forming)
MRGVWHRFANSVVVGYLAAGVVTALVRGSDDEWLLVHLFLLGAATNAIVIWSSHFTTTLLPPAFRPRRVGASALLALNVGVVCVLAGVSANAIAVTIAGAALVTSVVAYHGVVVGMAAQRARGGRFSTPVRFYWVAAIAVVFGIAAGTAMAQGISSQWYARVFTVHVQLNVFGWIALTVLGTEFALWPMVLRTRMADGVDRAARQTLGLCAVGLLTAVAGFLAANRAVAVAGLVAYLAGAVRSLEPFVRTALQRRPHTPSAWMLVAATTWLVVVVVADLVLLARSSSLDVYAGTVESLVPWAIAGFVTQVLVGALTYLLPVVVGGGPAGGRRAAELLDRWGAARTLVFNAGVVLVALPMPAAATDVGWWLVGVPLAVFVGLAAAALARKRAG